MLNYLGEYALIIDLIFRHLWHIGMWNDRLLPMTNTVNFSLPMIVYILNSFLIQGGELMLERQVEIIVTYIACV